MPDIQQIQSMLVKAGWIPSILMVGAWLYVAILLFVLLFYFFVYIIKVFTHQA